MVLCYAFARKDNGMTTISRRQVLVSGAMAAAVGVLGRATDVFAKAAQPKTKVAFDVPPGACDSHVHVFGDPQKYPFFSGRVYTPETASVDELKSMLSAIHMARVVV